MGIWKMPLRWLGHCGPQATSDRTPARANKVHWKPGMSVQLCSLYLLLSYSGVKLVEHKLDYKAENTVIL